MFPSQSSCTFNPFLPFTPSISVPHIPSATTSKSFVGSPILQSVAAFISTSYSSSAIATSKPALTTPASSTDDSQENDRTFAQNPYDSLEDAVNRLLGNYHRLSARHSANAQEKLCFSQKALVLAETNQFKCHFINLLNRLATLLVAYPQESLLKDAHMIFGVVTSSDSLNNLFKLHKSSKIHELLTMLYSTPLTSENLVYRDYLKDWNEKKTIKVEEQEKYVKPRNVKYNNAKGGVYGASSNLMDLIITKKTALCSEDDLEEESERHERSSTTSASSRTIAGENELPLTYNNFSSFPLISKVTTHAARKDSHIGETSHVHEIYDGCFFEDLTIIFKATDKLLMHYDEATERGGVHGQHQTSWPRPTPNYNKPLNNPHNFMIPTTFNGNQNTFHQPNFNQSVFEPTVLKTPPTMPTMERNIIPLNLFTLPQGTLLPATPFNAFNPIKQTMPGPVQQMPPLPFVNMMGPVNPITQVAPQVIQPVVNNIKGAQMEVKGGKKQQKGLDTGSVPKNSQTQTNKNVSAVKNPNSQKPKKKQDKGGFKLWDMISVQGKLKQ